MKRCEWCEWLIEEKYYTEHIIERHSREVAEKAYSQNYVENIRIGNILKKIELPKKEEGEQT